MTVATQTPENETPAGTAPDANSPEPATAGEPPATPEAVEPELSEAEADAQFEEGFKDDAPPTATPAEATTGEPAGADPAQATAPAAPAQPPKYVQITEEQLKRFEAATEIAATVEQRFGTAFGKMGGLERILTELQKATPAGQAVTVSAEDFEEMKADFPELAEMTAKGINRAMAKAKMRGTGGAEPAAPGAPAADPIEAVKQQLTVLEHNTAQNLVRMRHPDWREVVGLKPDGTAYQTPYREWLAKQSPEYQQEVSGSWDPVVIAGSLDKFKSTLKKPTPPTPPTDPRLRRFAGAVPPKSAGVVPTGGETQSEDKAFEEGYAKG